MSVLKKGARITGSARSKAAADVTSQYVNGRSIRELADAQGRSYGFVHALLAESGVELRGRGGGHRKKGLI